MMKKSATGLNVQRSRVLVPKAAVAWRDRTRKRHREGVAFCLNAVRGVRRGGLEINHDTRHIGLELAQTNSTNRFRIAWFAAAKGLACSQARSGKIQHQPFWVVQTMRLAGQAAITFHAYDCLLAAATAADLGSRDDRGHGAGRGHLNRRLRA